MISDGSGYAYQFFLNLPFGANERKSHAVFLNLPFGETMVEQRRSGSFDNPYKFNGKELDEETGLYYYGARYYNPKTSVFISVDPLAESTMTPYQYTYQNPVRYIDPTGMAAEDPPTKANRNNHNFEVGGKWVDKTGTYTVDRITDEGIEWRSM